LLIDADTVSAVTTTNYDAYRIADAAPGIFDKVTALQRNRNLWMLRRRTVAIHTAILVLRRSICGIEDDVSRAHQVVMISPTTPFAREGHCNRSSQGVF